jgi:K+ transporter
MDLTVGREPDNTRATAQAALAVGALGVVFGDIGTSPLYTVQTVFNPTDPHPVTVSSESVFGIISLIFWSVTLIVTVTYVLLVMRADNDGEGGILSLITLIRRHHATGKHRTKVTLAALGVFGASLFFGDSMITPRSPCSPRSKASRSSRHRSTTSSSRSPSRSSWCSSSSSEPAPRRSAGSSAR